MNTAIHFCIAALLAINLGTSMFAVNEVMAVHDKVINISFKLNEEIMDKPVCFDGTDCEADWDTYEDMSKQVGYEDAEVTDLGIKHAI